MAKALTELNLPDDKIKAIQEARQSLISNFSVINKIFLFGSAARGEMNEESDIDLMVLTQKPLSRLERHKITDHVCEINLKHGTNLSTLVIDEENWETGLVSFLPIKKEIMRDRISL